MDWVPNAVTLHGPVKAWPALADAPAAPLTIHAAASALRAGFHCAAIPLYLPVFSGRCFVPTASSAESRRPAVLAVPVSSRSPSLDSNSSG
jgi:hypothetical protein